MKRTSIHKHIYKVGNKYSIDKSINNERIHFKTCDTLHEAIIIRDKLKKNGWEPLPEDETEKQERLIKEYYLKIGRHGNRYHVRNNHDEYIGTTKIIEEALYFRDLYRTYPKNKVPRMNTVDLVSDNPYYQNGLEYPLPERLKLPPDNSMYGKGSIIKKGDTSFHVHHGKKPSYICACPTMEMALYVRDEMNKVDWDKSELQRILDDYPKYYTKLLFFYQYINKHRVWNQQTKDKKVYDGWEITIPNEFLEKEKSLEKIGVYRNIEDALFERDFLVEHDWDYNLLVETINDEENPYYDMTLPPYPTRKIRNISKRNYREKELTEIMKLIQEDPSLSQRDIADKLSIADVTIRNWLKRLYNTDYLEFKRLVLDGVNPLEVLKKQEQIIQPDLSTAKPNNYTGYVHHMKNGNYNVSKGGEYYGTYKDEGLARKIAKDMAKVDWDKSKLKAIQKKHGYTSPVMSKRWVYKQGRKWAVRRKDKNRKMLTYGVWYDKRIAIIARDMYVEYGFNFDNQNWINNMAEWIVEMLDLLPSTMFGRSSVEDIVFIEDSERPMYMRPAQTPGKYIVTKYINGRSVHYGTYSEEKAVRVVEFLEDNNWDKELLNVMQEMGEI